MANDPRWHPAGYAGFIRENAEVAGWADEQREIPGSGPWHYVNVPIAELRYDPRFCPPGGCVVSKIEHCRLVLSNQRAAGAQRRLALVLFVHFI